MSEEYAFGIFLEAKLYALFQMLEKHRPEWNKRDILQCVEHFYEQHQKRKKEEAKL